MDAGHTSKAKSLFHLTNNIQLVKNNKNCDFWGNYKGVFFGFFFEGGSAGKNLKCSEKSKNF